MPLPIVTPLTPEDLDFVLFLERQVFADAWTRRMYLTDLTSNPLATYLAVRPADGAGSPAATSADEWQAGAWAPADAAAPALLQGAAASLPPILAWGGFWLMVDEAHIATLAAHPDWRGCGLGQWLMLALLDAAAARGALTATLEVRVGNAPAIHLYDKLGFEIMGRRRHYYRDGEDGLIMTTPPLAEPGLRTRLEAAHQDAFAKLTRCFGAGAWRVGLAEESAGIEALAGCVDDSEKPAEASRPDGRDQVFI